MRNKIIYIVMTVAVVIGVTITLRQLILGGKDVSTSPQNATDSQVLQSITGNSSATGSETLHLDDKYVVDQKKYFDNNEWLLAHITPKAAGTAESAYVIMYGKNSNYSVIAGPGSSFPRDVLVDVPADVVNYLDSLGFVSEPVQ